MGRVPFRDNRVAGLDWKATAPAAAPDGIPGCWSRAGWLDGGFAAGALARFVTRAGHQQVEIGPWGHGGGSFADTLRPSGAADHDPLAPRARTVASLSSSPGTWRETAGPRGKARSRSVPSAPAPGRPSAAGRPRAAERSGGTSALTA